MGKIGDFCDLVKGQVGSIYVLGGQGELLKDIKDVKAWIYAKEDTSAHAKIAYELYLERKNNKNLRAFDCSGLVCWALVECGAKKKGFDTTANGLYKTYTTAISKHDLKDGDLCFKVKDGKAHHVGVAIGGKIVESKGRAYGVVSSSVTSAWNAFGRLKVEWEADSKPKDEPTYYFTLKRVLKRGCNGEDVKAVQKRLISLKFSCGSDGADGKYGLNTKNAVIKFQQKNAAACGKGKISNYDDGKVGELTCKALGGKWAKL